MFVFGLVHFQYNADANVVTTAISAFGSVNVSIVSLLTSLFGTGVDDGILAKLD
jgi:hypothetical protein